MPKVGFKLSKETRQKMSEAHKKRNREHPESNAMLGKHHSEETKRKMR